MSYAGQNKLSKEIDARVKKADAIKQSTKDKKAKIASIYYYNKFRKNTQIMETLTKFNRGFQSQATCTIYDDAIVYSTPKPHQACDDARRRINELGLPLTAKVTNYKTFVVCI